LLFLEFINTLLFNDYCDYKHSLSKKSDFGFFVLMLKKAQLFSPPKFL
jgi:hypothetical protein